MKIKRMAVSAKLLVWRSISASLFVAVLWPLHVNGEDLLPEEKVDEINQLIREYLMNNPEVILDSVQRFREKQEAMEQESGARNLSALRDQLENDPATPSTGNPEGDVTVVEFFDYRCGYCKSTLTTLLQLLSEDSGIRLVLKEFPILSDESNVAARAALAAGMQGQYFMFHNALMETRVSLQKDSILVMAEDFGLDVERLAIDMESPEIFAQVESNRKLAAALNIRGTPTFVIGEQILPGAVDIESLREIIQSVREG